MLIGDNRLSYIFRRGFGDGSGASSVPIFIGLCGVASAYFLGSVKNSNQEEQILFNNRKSGPIATNVQ